MAQQVIDIGAAPNTGGETFFSGATKINSNIAELQAKILTPAPDNLTIYVSPNGNDANDGLSTFTAVATILKACQIIHDGYYTRYNQTVTIQLANGTYTEAIELLAVHGDGIIAIRGNSGDPANVLVTFGGGQHVLSFAIPCRYRLEHFTITNTSAGTVASVNCRQKAYVEIGDGMVFGDNTSSTSDHIIATDTGIVNIVGNYSINGDCRFHYHSHYMGLIKANGITCTVTSPCTMSRFARAAVCSVIESIGSTYVNRNDVSTSAFNANIYENSVINVTGGTTANYFPGSGGPDANATSNGYCY